MASSSESKSSESPWMNASPGMEASFALDDSPVGRSTASQIVSGGKQVLYATIVVVTFMCIIYFACRGICKSTKAADCFLWMRGYEKTWEEYQQDHVAQGHLRLSDKEATWVEQLFNDAYSGVNRP